MEVRFPACGQREASDHSSSRALQNPAVLPPSPKTLLCFKGPWLFPRPAGCLAKLETQGPLGVKSGPHPPPWTQASCSRQGCSCGGISVLPRGARGLCALSLVFRKHKKSTEKRPAGSGRRPGWERCQIQGASWVPDMPAEGDTTHLLPRPVFSFPFSFCFSNDGRKR